ATHPAVPDTRPGTGFVLVGLFRTSDVRLPSPSWTSLDLPVPAKRNDRVEVDLELDWDKDPGTSPGETYAGVRPGGQADTNLSVAVDPRNPNDKNVVYVAGDRQATSDGRNSVGV